MHKAILDRFRTKWNWRTACDTIGENGCRQLLPSCCAFSVLCIQIKQCVYVCVCVHTHTHIRTLKCHKFLNVHKESNVCTHARARAHTHTHWNVTNSWMLKGEYVLRLYFRNAERHVVLSKVRVCALPLMCSCDDEHVLCSSVWIWDYPLPTSRSSVTGTLTLCRRNFLLNFSTLCI